MAPTSDETTSERAERLLADRTNFQLPPVGRDELVAVMDRAARPISVLAKIVSRRPSACGARLLHEEPATDAVGVGLRDASEGDRSGLSFPG
jgi:hypothetical protein